MRRALNENPVVQMVVIGVIAVILVFMLFTTVLKKEEATPPADPAAGSDPTAVASGDPAAAAPAAPAPSAPAPTAPASPAPGPASTALAASEGLPKDVVAAFERDRAIALLVVDPKGITDGQVEAWTRRLAARGKAEVFVADVAEIADYARITSGVAVSRAPALVVVQPRSLTADVPTASVSYGFRSPRSLEQALDDALYDGGTVTAYP